jgi:cytochrome P450
MSDGIPLTDRDFHTNFLLLVVAGNETTRHTITHTMRNLMANPDQLVYLQENPDMIPWAVEEFLRSGQHVKDAVHRLNGDGERLPVRLVIALRVEALNLQFNG